MSQLSAGSGVPAGGRAGRRGDRSRRSIIEQLKIIEPLTNPTAHGASAADAFHLVIPSLPGHGFSAKPATTGWDPVRIARAWLVLMKRLGYTQFVAQGGDWGAAVTQQMGIQAPPELLGGDSQRQGRNVVTAHRAPAGLHVASAQLPGEGELPLSRRGNRTALTLSLDPTPSRP